MKCLYAIALFLLLTAVHAQDMIWWEGEHTAETNFPEQSEFSPANDDQAAKLSGNAWLSNSGKYTDGEKKAFARYQITVPSDGTYNFWSRKFWKHGPFKWRFNDNEWKYITRDIALAESVTLRKHLTASWVFVDTVELKKGEHTFEIELSDEASKTSCFDVFLLIKGSFVPNGKLKPGEKTGLANPGYFAWEPSTDPLTAESVIDMRHLNEQLAGEKGFVKRSGSGFVDGSGKPIKFWMVQSGLFLNSDNATIDRWARRLAKYGVNLVRMQFSGFFNDQVKGDDARFKKRLERLHYGIAALKKQGIYSYFGHLYWHTHNPINDNVFPGYGKGKNAISLIFFSEQFQDYYKKYVNRIMGAKNPYTGVSLAKEPAVAFFEIHNETGLFFWRFKPSEFPEPELKIIETKFGDFLKKKYGSLEKAKAAWNGETGEHHTPDNLSAGRIGLYGAGHLTSQEWAVAQRHPVRAADQVEFMHTSVYNFYDKMKNDLNNELGLDQMIVGSNWKSADDKNLGGIERNANRAGDVVCRNSYFGVDYKKGGQQRFYAIELNDTYRYKSALKPPARPAPLATPQPNDRPFMITENNWTRPNRYRSEWPFLIATYAQMMGIDGWNFFALGASEWQTQMAVWDLNNPSILGQFPATALMFRRGDVQEAQRAAVYEKRSLKDVYDLKGTQIYALSGKDDMWVSMIGDKEGAQNTNFGVDPRSYFVGPVVQEFHDGKSELNVVDLKKYIDDKKKTITSITNELHWDYGNGIVTVNTPRAQGAGGFLNKGGTIKVGDISITCDNEYATVLAVALDDKPLKSSKKILVQVGTWDLPYGFQTEPDGPYQKITNLGGYPLNVKRVQCSITLPSGKTATVLDENGYRTDRKAKTAISGGAFQVTLPEDSLYTVIE